VDLAEQLSGASLMRQAIRDMDVAVKKASHEADLARAKRIQAEHHIEECRKQLATLKEQAAFAMSKKREDLATAAIGRQLEVEERKIGEALASLKARAKQMQADYAAFQSAQRAAAYDEEAPSGASARAERTARVPKMLSKGPWRMPAAFKAPA
jgi:phage shock protein A